MSRKRTSIGLLWPTFSLLKAQPSAQELSLGSLAGAGPWNEIENSIDNRLTNLLVSNFAYKTVRPTK